MYKLLGSRLIKSGGFFLKRAFSIKQMKVITNDYVKSLLTTVGIDKIYCSDEKYYVIDWEIMKEIIKYDWIDKKKYVKDRYDCDDFANSFKARMAEIYGINSVATAGGIMLYSKNTNQKLGYHRANLILTTEDNVSRAYIFEPMNDKFCLIERGKPIIIGNWRYELNTINF